jgi:hypothetical protein
VLLSLRTNPTRQGAEEEKAFVPCSPHRSKNRTQLATFSIPGSNAFPCRFHGTGQNRGGSEREKNDFESRGQLREKIGSILMSQYQRVAPAKVRRCLVRWVSLLVIRLSGRFNLHQLNRRRSPDFDSFGRAQGDNHVVNVRTKIETEGPLRNFIVKVIRTIVPTAALQYRHR